MLQRATAVLAIHREEATRLATLAPHTPVLTAGATLTYTEADSPTAIDTTVTVNDVDNTTLTGATVQLTTNYINGQDILSFVTIGAISGSFNAATGTMTLTGTDTLANYQAALRTVKYSNTSNSPSVAPRTVVWIGNDVPFTPAGPVDILGRVVRSRRVKSHHHVGRSRE